MTSTLESIPVLVPVPATSRTHTPQPAHVSEVASEDRFASLFSPPTPPASRNSGSSSSQPPIFSNPTINPDCSQVRPRIHARTASDADWGSFMTVPASQDPLATLQDDDFASPVAAPAGPAQADPSFEFFETFGETARQASEAKRRSVLNELLEHEDDPLYFLSSHAAQSGTAQTQTSDPVLDFSLLDLDPIPSSSPPPAEPVPDPAPSLLDQTIGALFGAGSSPPPADSSSTNHDSFAQHVNFDQAFGTPTFTPSEYHSSDLLHEALSSSTDTTPATAAKEILQPMSNHTRSTSFSARWIPTMRVKRENSLHSDPSSSPDIDTYTGPSSLTSTLSRTVAAALTVAPGPPSRKQNPFAPEVFQPTSGAPGYAGEHAAQPKKGTTFEFKPGDTEDKRAVVLEGRRSSTTPVLDPVVASMVRPALPVLSRLSRSWELLYSLDQHGISLRTLYARCAEPSRRMGPRPALLVVRDAGGGTFGAFVSEGIRASPGSFYGGGECFLWRADESGSSIHVYKWTGRNDYVALCENNSISFGGGDGHYGLFLDDVLQDGSSAPCPTFSNEILCTGEIPAGSSSKSLDFECVGVEVWAIGT